MLGLLFGFNARLGRLHYFLATLALGLAAAGATVAIVLHGLHGPTEPQAAVIAASWPMIILMIAFGFATFTLQSMRLRDIGWDPVWVIPAWIALHLIDAVIAMKIPAWSLGPKHSGTALSAIVNLVLLLSLLFWPSGDFDTAPPRSSDPTPPQPRPRSEPGAVAATRIARAGGFGRRG
jgi:uncharacterized membrane protein YhaH (DUF805 family)